MLTIKNVSAVINTTEVLSDVNLKVNKGEVHVIMGPKESGKSSLVHMIQGNPYMLITEGSINFNGKNITKKSPDKRSQLGIFTSFQTPPEIAGLTNLEATKIIYENNKEIVFTSALELCYKNLIRELELGGTFTNEFVNDDDRLPSDWRKSEILQMLMINPNLAMLDEIDLEQDDHSLELIANTILSFMKEPEKACIIVTNNQKFLDLLNPTHVHVVVEGRIATQGGPELYKRIIEDGYSQFSES
jgi:Fe-S cluster assembly ATP-binding protein